MENEQQSVLKVLVELVDKVSEPLREINEDFEAFSESAHGWWTASAEIFAGYEAIEKLIEPAAAMAEVQARLGLAGKFSAEQMAELKEQAENLSESFPKNAESIVSAQTELYKTLGNIEQTKEATEVATKLATVLGVDAAEGATVLASTYENLGDRTKPVVEEMGAVADKLAVLTDLFPTSGMGAARMAMEMSRLGEVAKTYGIGQNQVFAVLAEMNKLHVGGMRGAGMVLQQLIQSLGELDKNGAPTLAKYGLVLEKDRQGNLHFIATLERMAKMHPAALQSLLQRFHGQGQAIALALAHLPEIEENYRKFENSAGSLTDAAGKLSQTPQAKFQQMVDTVSNLADRIGTQLLPNLIKVVDFMAKWVDRIDGFLGRHAMLTKAVGGLITAFAGLLTLAGVMKFANITFGLLKLGAELLNLRTFVQMATNAWWVASTIWTEGIGGIGTAFAALFESNPLGWIITALSLLTIGAYELYEHWDKVKELFEKVADAIERIAHVAKDIPLGIWDAITGQWSLPDLQTVTGGMGFNPVTAASIAANTANQHIQHNEFHIDVHAAPGQSAQEVAGAVHDTIQLNLSDLQDHAAEKRRRENRLTFQDSTNPYFAR